MAASIGERCSLLSVAALASVAAVAYAKPATFASLFGLPIGENDHAARGYIAALGARDATLAAVTIALILRGDRGGVRATLGIASCLAAADYATIARNPAAQDRTRALVSGAGAFVLLALSATP